MGKKTTNVVNNHTENIKDVHNTYTTEQSGTTSTSVHNDYINNEVRGDYISGGYVTTDNTSNTGTQIYKLQNLDTLNYGWQSIGTVNGLRAEDLLRIASDGGDPFAAAGITRAERIILL